MKKYILLTFIIFSKLSFSFDKIKEAIDKLDVVKVKELILKQNNNITKEKKEELLDYVSNEIKVRKSYCVHHKSYIDLLKMYFGYKLSQNLFDIFGYREVVINDNYYSDDEQGRLLSLMRPRRLKFSGVKFRNLILGSTGLYLIYSGFNLDHAYSNLNKAREIEDFIKNLEIKNA